MPPAALMSLRDASDAGWTALGHCEVCGESRPGNVALFAARPCGRQPVADLVRRGTFCCAVCNAALSGVTLMEPVRPDGLRRIVEIGRCPAFDAAPAMGEASAALQGDFGAPDAEDRP